MSLSVYDYVVIGFYLVFMLLLGPIYKSFSKTSSDYFRGGGTMLWWVVGSSSFMVTFSAWSFTGGAAKAYETGTFFLLLFFCNIVALIFMYFFTAAKYRQMRIITAIEGVRKRFGKVNEQVFTWLHIPTYLLFGGVWLYSVSIFMSGAFNIPTEVLIVLLGAVVIGMTVVGGSWAATAGDFVQMLVVVVITLIMAVMVLLHPDVGGFGGLIKQLPQEHFDWTSFARPSVLTFFGVTLMLNQLMVMNSMTVGAARYIFVKNGADARKAVLVSIAGFVLLAPIWMIPAVAATIFHPDLAAEFPNLNNPNEAAYVAMAISLLPNGMLGLLICGIFAASMTTMNSQLNVAAGTFVRNFYIRVLKKDASESRQILVGRIFIVFYGLSWMVIALIFRNLKGMPLFDLLLLIAASVNIPVAVPMFLGIFMKKVPAWSGWSTMLVGLIFSLGMRFVLTPDNIQAWISNMVLLKEPLNPRELGDMNIAITTAVLFLVCIAWFFVTKLFYNSRDTQYIKQVDAFFDEMHTPIDMAQEHGPAHESDRKQSNVMGTLCMIYGAFILLLLFVPNTNSSRVAILACGLFIGGLGLILRMVANNSSRVALRESDGDVSKKIASATSEPFDA